MAVSRQEKVGKQVQKDLSEILNAKGVSLVSAKMITVTAARITPDLSFAKVYLSIFPSNNAQKDVDILNEHLSVFRKELGNRMSNQLKSIPDFTFYLDDSLDYIEKIDKLLDN